MVGYSGTPLPKKLGIKEGTVLALLDAPTRVLPDLPPGVSVKHQARGQADVVVAFFRQKSQLEKRVLALGNMIHPDGGLWIAWPKRSSGVQTDLNEHVVRELSLPTGMVDNKVCAIDETWTGLRMVWRLERRGPAAGAQSEPGGRAGEPEHRGEPT